MKAKRIIAMLLYVLMLGTLFPVAAFADGETATDTGSNAGAYTVTLDPGDGTGEPITYTCSFDTYDSLPTSATSAAHLHFYRVENNVAGFNLKVDYCPDSFTAPENCLFDGWDGIENIKRIPSGNPDVTVTARWKAAAYTVTLDPGEGTGEPITYSCPFDEYDNLPTNAGHLKFYKLQNNVVGFKLNADYCPDSFTAPENYLFDGWDGIDKINRIADGKPNVTVTARWKLDQTRTYGPINGIPKVSGGYVYLGGIRWRVIGQSSSSWLLISADVLGGEMTWEVAKAYCGTMYDSFMTLEQAAVIPTTKTDHDYTSLSVDNLGNPHHYYAADLNNATLFLLSAAEAEFYFTDNSDRAANDSCWLRSPSADSTIDAGDVAAGGGVSTCFADVAGDGARPAFQFNPASVLFSSAATGGKSSAAEVSDKFVNFPAASESGGKLTLVDSSRSGFYANQTGNVCPGGSLAVLYHDAPTGTNEYVSAMICDASGTPLYYASVPSEGSGTMELTVPSDLTVGGSYTLKVFSEQQNGDYKTDYASNFRSFALNVTEAYIITFQNYNTLGLQTVFAAAGETPVYTGETPVRPSDNLQVGYVFDGWKPALGPVTGNTTYTARFREVSKNLVTFSPGTGSGTMADDSYFESEGTYTLPQCGFTAPKGHVFKDWQVAWSNGNGATSSTARMPGASVTGLTGHITVTANWIELSLGVSPANAGTAVYESSAVYENGAFTATANEGYTFDHWEYANDEYSMAPDGTEWPIDNPWPPAEVSYKIYTAVFSANEYTITILDNIQNGTVEKYSGTPKTGNTIRLTATPNEGYRIDSLSYTPEGGTPVRITEIDKNGKFLFTMPASNVTVTAVFVPENAPAFKSYTLLLSGQIGVNFYVDLSMLTEEERQGVTMDFTVNRKTTTANFDAGFTNPGGNGYYGFTCYINSVQMADEIAAVLHYTQQGEEGTVSQTYSAKAYVDSVLSHSGNYSANAVALVEAIADYGHYAQPFLATNNGWTVGKDHVAMEGAHDFTDAHVEAASAGVESMTFAKDLGMSQIEKVTYSLNLESETAIRVYLRVKDGYEGAVTATMGGNALDCVKQSDGRYRIEIGGIPAHKLGEVYNITVDAGGKCTVDVSALCYVHTVLYSDSSVFSNDAAHHAVTALYNYYVATTNYKSNPNG